MSRVRAYWELTKPRLTSMVIFTTWLGYALGTRGVSLGGRFIHAIAGSWLVAAGAAALNQYLERDRDALMRRTQMRPLPQRQLQPRDALFFGMALSALGLGELVCFVNGLTGLLAFVSLSVYVACYTPLKTKTSLCTLVGAIPGAIPPMMGWTAAQGALDPAAWSLFGILFLWQLPHFLAIAWMYREDYARAGFAMLPVIDPDGGSTSRMILLYTAVLIPVTLIPARMGLTDLSYFWAALLFGLAFFVCGAMTAFHRSAATARRLLHASILYLPALLGWMAWCRAV